MMPILSMIVLIPLIFAALALFTKTKEQARVIALAGTVIVLLLTVYMYFNFDSTIADNQFEELAQWVPSLGITYHLGVDGIAMPLILLNAIVLPFLVLFTWNDDRKSPNKFYACILATEGCSNRCIHRTGLLPVLYILGTYTRTALLYGEHMGEDPTNTAQQLSSLSIHTWRPL